MYWSFDNVTTIYDTHLSLSDAMIVECCKAIAPSCLSHTGAHEIIDFKPGNGHLPEIPKKLVILEVSNGLSTVGPAWFSGDPSDLHWFKSKPANVYKIG